MRSDEQIRWLCGKPCHCDHLLSHEAVVVDYQGKDWDLDLDRIVGQNDMVVLLLRWIYMKGLVPLEYQRANVRSMCDGTTNQGLNGLEKSCCFYYFSLFLGLITSCCSGKWALTHCNPPHPFPWKIYSGRIKDQTWKTAEIEPSMATVLMIISLDGDVQFIVGLVSFIINSKGM